jgi:endonuclease-3
MECMKKRERAALVASILQELFSHPMIPLQHRDPYTLLIAVLLSAQSTDARVNRVTPLLFAKASSPNEMVQLSVEEITEIIRPCGLFNTKAKAIWNLSKILLEKYHGRVPANFAALEKLPGVGHKTASVVMTQAFHKSAFPVDTHIHRCAKRWGLSDGTSVEKTEADLKRLFPKSTWHVLHLQIIYFARTYCKARGHKSTRCPICSRL